VALGVVEASAVVAVFGVSTFAVVATFEVAAFPVVADFEVAAFAVVADFEVAAFPVVATFEIAAFPIVAAFGDSASVLFEGLDVELESLAPSDLAFACFTDSDSPSLDFSVVTLALTTALSVVVVSAVEVVALLASLDAPDEDVSAVALVSTVLSIAVVSAVEIVALSAPPDLPDEDVSTVLSMVKEPLFAMVMVAAPIDAAPFDTLMFIVALLPCSPPLATGAGTDKMLVKMVVVVACMDMDSGVVGVVVTTGRITKFALLYCKS